MKKLSIVVLLLWAGACPGPEVQTDAGTVVPPRADASSDDAAASDATSSDAAADDRGRSDAAAPDQTQVDAATPDTAAHDTAAPDTATPDTATHDAAVPDTAAQDTATPDTAAPDTAAPDTATPDTATPDTAADTGSPDLGPPATCSEMCTHIYNVCGLNFTNTSGEPAAKSECISFCERGDFSLEEVQCFAYVECTEQAAEACFGAGGPVCPRDMDCSGRQCGLDPVCFERCGTCPTGLSCTPEARCESATGYGMKDLGVAWPRHVGLVYNRADLPVVASIDDEGDLYLLVPDEAGQWGGALFDSPGTAYGDRDSLAMTFDQTTGLHLVYYASTAAELRYLTIVGEDLVIERVDADPSMGRFPAVDTDSAGNPCVSYTTIGGQQLRYAVRRGADDWETQVVRENDMIQQFTYTRVDLDAADQPVVGYVYGGDKLFVSTFASDTWSHQLAHTGQFLYHLGMAHDADGALHLATHETERDMVVYVTNASGEWQSTRFGSASAGYAHVQLALDADGAPLVSFIDHSDVLELAAPGTTSWDSTYPLDTTDVLAPMAMQLDAAGRPGFVLNVNLRLTYVD